MKTLGIIGGTGPESTIDYYRLLIATYRARMPDANYPRIIINSVDNQKLLAWVGANELGAIVGYLLEKLRRLERAGVDFALLAANTTHIVFDELQRGSPLPLLSIVEATCAAAKAAGLKRLGLFGTRFTMQGEFYVRVFDQAGLVLVRPDAAEQDYIHEKYISELIPGVFLPETRSGLLAIVERMKAASAIDAVILGGTELALILRETNHAGVPILNTTKIRRSSGGTDAGLTSERNARRNRRRYRQMNIPSLRLATKADASAITEILNHYIAESTATFIIEPQNLEERLAWFEQRSERHPAVAAEVEGVLAG